MYWIINSLNEIKIASTHFFLFLCHLPLILFYLRKALWMNRITVFARLLSMRCFANERGSPPRVGQSEWSRKIERVGQLALHFSSSDRFRDLPSLIVFFSFEMIEYMKQKEFLLSLCHHPLEKDRLLVKVIGKGTDRMGHLSISRVLSPIRTSMGHEEKPIDHLICLARATMKSS